MKRFVPLVLLVLVATAVVWALARPFGAVPPMGALLDPVDGVYRTARGALHDGEAEGAIPGLSAPVTVLRDERGVPHIFAANDLDAARAMGYVTAQDRLFQMDFLPRAASGRLAAALGPDLVETDRFLRGTGMDWGARANLARIREEDGIEWQLAAAYSDGVNAYLDALDPADLPFEFRLLGYRPDRYSPLQSMRVLQYMTFDLTWRSDDVRYAALREALGEDFGRLYPRYNDLTVPIIPDPGGVPAERRIGATLGERVTGTGGGAAGAPLAALAALERYLDRVEALRAGVAEGHRPGKGSNNWVIAPERSATGAALLAGDPHLGLSLPAVWYEAHLVTPTMDVYGATIPGTPLIVIGYNNAVAWSPTNTGADVIDHYALEVDDARERYRVDGAWRPLELVRDTIPVKGAPDVVDTLRYSAFGPVTFEDGEATALRWIAHRPSRTIEALYGMNRADGYAAFEEALRHWDSPMQNIAYADRDGTISLHSAGLLPRRGEREAASLLDGTADAPLGPPVPFEELPHSVNPPQGFLTSTNQQPADSTYRHYLGRDFGSSYRPIRIDSLLRGKERHSVEDLMRYQADVDAVQRDLFVPLLDSITGLSPRAAELRALLGAWDGVTGVDRPEPLVLDVFLDRLRALAWDEPAFGGRPRPGDYVLYRLLTRTPGDPYLDIQGTPAREDAVELLATALGATADTLAARHGWDPAAWRWGDHHKIVFPHLTGSRALQPLWRGPVEFPGFEATLTPAAGRQVTHTASWRMIVDFSTFPPTAHGIYPGGQSGNPFSPHYDLHLPAFLSFEYYDLYKPAAPERMDPERISSRLLLR